MRLAILREITGEVHSLRRGNASENIGAGGVLAVAARGVEPELGGVLGLRDPSDGRAGLKKFLRVA